MLRRLLPCLLLAAAALATPIASTEVHPLPGDAGLSVVLEFPEPLLESVDGREIARLPEEGLMGRAGQPDLPLVNRMVRIPANSGVELEVLQTEWIPLGQHDIRPMQERLHTEAELPLPWVEDPASYGRQGWWPADWIKTGDPMLVRETRLVQLSVAPLRWNPVSGELQRLARLELIVHFAGQDDRNNPLRASEEGVSDEDGGMVYNMRRSERAFVGGLLGDRVLNGAFSAPENAAPLETIQWGAPELPLNYLVIARAVATQQSSFQAWIDWKRAKGHHVTILTDADISWNATAIRSAILDQYINSDYRPHYVALVGDTQGTYSLPSHTSQYDHYYATIAGNDILADVVVGRISVENATQLSNVLTKIVNYERSPYLGDTNWLRRASFLTGSGHCGESMSQLSRSVAFDLVDERGYTQIDTAFCANSPNYVYNWFNQGVSFYNYRGWIGMEGLSRDQLENLSQGDRTPVAVTFTCSSGDFVDDWNGRSYTESFLRGGSVGNPGGAVAAMGFCTSNTHTAYNNVICGGFWSGMLDYQIQQVGTCMFRGKFDLYQTLPPNDNNVNNFSYWANLMGDPGMDMWCGVPGSLQFDGLEADLAAAAQTLAVRVLDQDGEPVEGAAVCGFDSQAFAVTGLTDADGRVWLELPAPASTSVQFTASYPWLVPATQRLDVEAGLAQPIVAELAIVDGDGDGLWEAGEAAQLTPTFLNPSSDTDLPALSVTLSLRDAASGAVTQAVAQLPALAAGESATTDVAFEAATAPDWTLGAPVDLAFDLVDGGDLHHSAAWSAAVSSPRIGIVGITMQSGPLYPGQTDTISLRVRNDGVQDWPGGEGLLSFPEGSGMSLDGEALTIPALVVDESTTLTATVTAGAGLVPGYTAPLTLSWGDAVEGPTGEAAAAVTLGAQAVGDPTGPDAHGYYAFESSDTQWLQAPVYSWIEIAPNAGGDGDVVALTDNGDEQDDSRRVDLPFPFMIYGRLYESMAVCSNGFVAFGESAHLETDFRNHFLPTGMGPEPMLAPMWDDHKLTVDAQVCTKYLEESGLYVVEWYRMRTNSNNRVNTFQLILYDPAVYPTATGDGDVVFQWETWDDSQSNSQDFPYCTVGLKDQTGTIGLTLRNYQQEPATIDAIGAGRAVRLTTGVMGDIEPADLVLETESVQQALDMGEATAVADSIVLSNVGGAPLIWQASILIPADWPSAAGRDHGGPDAEGYSWIDSEEEEGPAAGWVDVWDQSQTLTFTDGNDGVAGPLDLDFDLPYYGEPRNQLWISANGFLTFEAPMASYWQNSGGLPADNAPQLALAPWWDDLFPNDVLPADHIRMWSNGTDSLVVTWNAVPHYNQAAYGGPFTFQVVIESNGRFAFNYGDMAASDVDSDSGTIGISGENGQGFQVRHMQPSRDDLTILFRPPFWLRLETANGLVAPGHSQSVRLSLQNHVGGSVLPEGDYTSSVRLATSDGDQPVVLVPVSLHVGSVGAEPQVLPEDFAVSKPWPNPFNPTTRLSITLPQAAPVTAVVYNLLGQEALRLLDGRTLSAGEHQLTVDGSRLASGLYLLRVESLQRSEVRRLLLIK